MTWIYQGEPFTDDLIKNNTSFVYIITNTLNNKQYIGKKKFSFYRRKKVTGRKNRKTVTMESDWQIYFGSNKALLEDVKKYGDQHFKREILHLCKTVGVSSYLEAKEQMIREVLEQPHKYYNEWIACKVQRQHLKGKL